MKKITLSFLLLLITVVSQAQKNQKLVVLPYVINIEGNIPPNSSANEIQNQQITKSVYYQAEMISCLKNRSNRWRFRKTNPIIMTQADINKTLAAKGYTIAQCATVSNQELQTIFPDAKIIRGNLSIHIVMPVANAVAMNTAIAAINYNTPLIVPSVRHTLYSMIVSLENTTTQSVDWSGSRNNRWNAKKILKHLKRHS